VQEGITKLVNILTQTPLKNPHSHLPQDMTQHSILNVHDMALTIQSLHVGITLVEGSDQLKTLKISQLAPPLVPLLTNVLNIT
jgi:hypothetical protein